MFIKPLCALHVTAAHAAEVLAPPYDVVNVEQVRALVADNPYHFLRVTRPDAFVAVAPAPRRRLIFTGHSNGGFGAWMFGTHYPDAALGVAPLAGMATMGTTESVQRPPGIADKLWKVIDSTVEEYRGDSLAPNLVGIPFMARAGAMDRVIDPRSTRRMASLLQAAGIAWQEKKSQQGSKLVASGEGIDATVVELAGKEHWWWDTYETNDGGALDDKQLRAFFKRALSSGKSHPGLSHQVQLRQSRWVWEPGRRANPAATTAWHRTLSPHDYPPTSHWCRWPVAAAHRERREAQCRYADSAGWQQRRPADHAGAR